MVMLMAKIKPIRIEPNSIKPDPDTELAKADPIDHIMTEMNSRGFDSLWTEKKTGRHCNTHLAEFNDDRKLQFLRKLAVTGRVAYSAACVGVSRYCVYTHKSKDPVFAEACLEAMTYFRDLLEGEMYRRGVEGYEEGVVGGKDRDQVIMIPKYSDRMLELLGRIHMPEMRQQNVKMTGKVESNQNIVVNNSSTFDFSNMPPEDLAMVKTLLENQARRKEEEENTIEGVIDNGQ
jgi:hypothetical protein